MAGKGKVGKKSVKRNEIKKQDGNSSLTRGGIRRLARRGGVRRISSTVFSEVRDFVDYFLNTVVKDSAVFAEHAKRKTITAIDVIYALKRSGRTIYGYGVWFSLHLFPFIKYFPTYHQIIYFEPFWRVSSRGSFKAHLKREGLHHILVRNQKINSKKILSSLN